MSYLKKLSRNEMKKVLGGAPGDPCGSIGDLEHEHVLGCCTQKSCAPLPGEPPVCIHPDTGCYAWPE